MITVYAVRRYPSQVGSLVWLRIAQPKMSRFGAILNNQPSGNKKSHHHHYHPDLSLSTWAPSKSSQVQFWNWCKSENRNCKKALTQSALSKVGLITFYAVQIVPNGMLVYPLQGGAGHTEQEAGDLLKLPAQSKADLESKRSCGRLELLLSWKCSHLYHFAPFLFEAWWEQHARNLKLQ